ncbi:serine hydrolase domain-containing protein [Hymenobacter rigui]|uniref:Class A beta-lactamase-related serine hydrolase n=1 Tax=Hymenobacter rigui TaxID=334424 RepID=A0A428KME5_9BACT|nr:serine hydrolase domain-containing protein [Hymenobacter rigui]RSK47593.1 class A beta-lactamase-related serine hydrolase [Hymenobacter rigui]
MRPDRLFPLLPSYSSLKEYLSHPLLLACLLLLPGCLPLARFTQQPRAGNHAVDTFIRQQMKALGIPGLAVAVIKKGKRVKVSAYGSANLEWNRPVTVHTNFQIASCTKLLTSTLVLKAIYAGKLRLQDPVGRYLDSIPPSWQALRVEHLLSHSSGLREFQGNAYASTATVVRALKDSTLEYVPGTSQHYAQADFMLAGHILEKIYGKPFPQILREEVLLPLHMMDGAYDMEQRVGSFMRTDLIAQKVTTYYDWEKQLRAYKYLYPQYTYTAGGYFASIDDLANWAIGLDQNVLFPAAFARPLLYTRGLVGGKPSDFSAAGWALPEEQTSITYAGHSGGPGLGDVWRFPEEGYTVIVLTNDGELLPGLARAIAAFYVPGLTRAANIRKFER